MILAHVDIFIYMSATDVGWAPPGGVKEETMRLPGRAWPSQLFLWGAEIGLGYCSRISRGHSYCRYCSIKNCSPIS